MWRVPRIITVGGINWSIWWHKESMLRRRRSLLVSAIATVGLSGALLLVPSPAAAQEMPPWPPPAPTPPFPSLNPTPGQIPPAAGSAAPRQSTPVAAPAAAPTGVAAVQQRLKDLAYDPGRIDGKLGPATTFALFAFQKAQGLKVTGTVTPEVTAALANPKSPPVLGGAGDRVEVHLGPQLLTTYKGGRLVLISHISSGSGKAYCENGHCGNAITPTGNFSILWSRSGWETAPLGRLYNPQYFTTAGHAIHRSTSVPLYPASHGCVRIPMHTAAWFPSLVARGTPVIVR